MSDRKNKKNTVSGILAIAVVIVLAAVLVLVAHRTRNIDAHVFYNTYSNVYPSMVRANANRHFKERGITYQNYDGSGNQTTQSEQIFSTLCRDPQMIAVNMVDCNSDDAATMITEAAARRDAYVIFLNGEIGDEVINSYDKAVYIGTKIEEAGIIQGRMIGDYLLKHYEEIDLNHDGKISYILFKGQEGNAESDARTEYSVKTANEVLTAAGYPELVFYDPNNPKRYLLDQSGTWSAQVANEYMASTLIQYCDDNNNMIELIIGNNDNMAEGAISALQKVGYNTGRGKKCIPVFGVDATESAKSLIHSGCMTGTVMQDADKMAETMVKMCENVLNDRELLFGLSDIPVDEDCRKLRIQYAEYTEE